MKKYILTLSAAVFIISAGCSKNPASSAGAYISFLLGDVIIHSQGTSNAAVMGDKLLPEMKITAGKDSFADIRIKDNSFRVMERSEISLKELIIDSGTSTARADFKLEKGSVYASISKKLQKGDSYQISTNTAVAATRGTEYIVTIAESGNKIVCLSGIVDVTVNATGETVAVEPGQLVKVENSAISKPEKIPADEMKYYMGISEDIKNRNAASVSGAGAPAKDEVRPAPGGIEPDRTGTSGKID
jgi:hypothetical protein